MYTYRQPVVNKFLTIDLTIRYKPDDGGAPGGSAWAFILDYIRENFLRNIINYMLELARQRIVAPASESMRRQ